MFKSIHFLKLFIPIAMCLVVQFGFSQEVAAFQIYTSKGKKVSYQEMVKQLKKTDVVLFGELHNNAVAHFLQVKVAKSLHENKSKKLIIGAEMFERDQAEILQNYLNGSLDVKVFEKEMRLWLNYKTDYKPLLNFAKDNQIKYVATNVPRRFASLVYKKGVESLDTLSAVEKSWLAPLPYPYDKNLPGYLKMMEMFKDSNHANENFPKSQAIKDATMAYFLVKNMEVNSLFLHLNGSYHSDYHDGIVWYLKQYNKALQVQTISVVEQASVKSLDDDHLEKANFVIVVDADMPKSYE